MSIVFFQSGRWSGTNAAIEQLLRREFPDERLVVVDTWTLLRRRPLLLARLIATGLWRLRPPVHLGRGEWGFFLYSPPARRAITRLAQRAARRELDGEAPRFTFQAPARTLVALPGIPHFCYVDTTESLKPLGRSGRRTPVERAVLALESDLFHRCSRSFVHAEPIARAIAADYGVPLERAVTVYGGTNLPLEPPPRAAGDGSPRILFVAVEWSRKGGDVLVDAFRALRPRYPELELHLVGVDVDPGEPGCIVHGRLGRDELVDQLARATVFCLPARRDFFPNVVREAMRAGVPVVASRATGLPEIARDGEACLLVEADDVTALAEALARLLDDASLRERLGEAGRRLSLEHFTWEAVGERIRREILAELS